MQNADSEFLGSTKLLRPLYCLVTKLLADLQTLVFQKEQPTPLVFHSQLPSTKKRTSHGHSRLIDSDSTNSQSLLDRFLLNQKLVEQLRSSFMLRMEHNSYKQYQLKESLRMNMESHVSLEDSDELQEQLLTRQL